MIMDIGEMLDRISILMHKAEKIGEKAYPEFVAYTIDLFTNMEIKDYNKAIQSLKNLYSINGEIWKLESDIRKGKEKMLGEAEVGRRALKIRDWNNSRVAEKNHITKLLGGKFQDFKKDHASA